MAFFHSIQVKFANSGGAGQIGAANSFYNAVMVQISPVLIGIDEDCREVVYLVLDNVVDVILQNLKLIKVQY